MKNILLRSIRYIKATPMSQKDCEVLPEMVRDHIPEKAAQEIEDESRVCQGGRTPSHMWAATVNILFTILHTK